MSNAKLNIQETLTETGIGRMPMEYAERKSNITSIEVQPSNVRGDRLIDICPSKGNGKEETMRLRHLIFRFTKWFRPLISDILSQEENLAMFEELAMEGVGEIVVGNLHSEENGLSMNQRDNHGIEHHSMKYSNNDNKGKTLILEENLAEFEELTQVGVTVTVTSLALGDMRASDRQPNQSIIGHTNVYKGDGKGNEGHGECCNASYSVPDNDLDYEIEQIMVDALTMQRLEDSLSFVPGNTNPNLDHNHELTDDNAIQIPSTCHKRSMKQLLLKLSDEDDDRLNDIYPSKGNGNEETMRLRHLIFRFAEWFRPVISHILLSQDENLALFEELAMEGLGEIVVGNIVSKENRPSMNQRDNQGSDHNSMQCSNNEDSGEILKLEENLAEFEELTQVGVTETLTSLASGDMRGSGRQPNQSITELTKVYEGDVKGGEGHAKCRNASYSDPNNDLDYEIEQIMVDALTMQSQEDSLPLVPGNTNPNFDHHHVLTDGNAIQVPSISHLSTKQPLIELADEETKMDQTACYNKNENFSAGGHTQDDDSIIPPSEQQEESRSSNKQRMDLKAQPASNIVLVAKEGSIISEKKGDTNIEVGDVEVIVPTSLPGATSKTAEESIEKVLKWLSDENVETIGLQGTNGIGKTWTTRRVVDIAVESCLFDVVIWVNVGFYNLKNIQMQIIDQLKLFSITKDNQEETEEGLRQKISVSLAKKTFLLIRDEIKRSTSYNLDKLGIPHSSQRNKSSKVLITGATCYMELAALDRVLSLDGLTAHEAWCLFCDKAGVTFDSPDRHPVAEALVKDCFGVPLQIIIIAGALRNIEGDTSLTLEAKLKIASNLRTSRSLYTQDIGYAMLPTKAMKACFLYCTLYPEYHHISVKGLITSWIMEGFIEGFDSLEDAYEEGQYILKELRDRYLLFKLDGDHVTMHDSLLYRKTYIKSDRSDVILAKAGIRLTIPELYTKQDSFRKICLMDGSLQTKYPDCLEFPESSTLLLHGTGGHLSSEIPDVFFQQMQNLRVLALLHTRMSSLPSSFSNLNDLCVLVLVWRT